MRVVVLGGYGVFGSRLAELLVRDGHEVWIAGRDPDKAQALAARIGGTPLAVDLRRNPEAVFAVSPDVVVDAAGPFQAFRADDYPLARLCIANGADYFDLSDDAGYTAGIAVLDDAARQAGIRVLSGASSVPGLSSSVVAALSDGMDQLLAIDTAILPGNRAPRGTSVIASILGGAGEKARIWRGGAWREIRGWSDPATYEPEPGLRRKGYFIHVPDIDLFPAFFGARSVIFRAGMELPVMNTGLRAVALLRQRWPFRVTPGRAGLFRRLADLLYPFGSDRGGMVVTVTGKRGSEYIRRRWRLVAEAGDGPYMPGIVIRTLLCQRDRIAPGARACLAGISLEAAEAACDGLAVRTGRVEESVQPLFAALLGTRWQDLPPAVQALHTVIDLETWSGRAEITRGRSIPARLAALLFGFPAEGKDVPVTVTVTITRTGTGETWERNFAGRRFRSYLSSGAVPGRFRERFGPLTCEMDLPVSKGRLGMPVRRGWFLGIPVPGFLLPGSETAEYEEDGRFRFDVALKAPLGGGLIVRYRGWLEPDVPFDA